MLLERGVDVDHSTIYRWVQYYAPKILDKLKYLIKPTLGFKSMKTAYATIKGFEVMRMFKKGQFEFWKYGQGVQGEIRIITDNLLAFLKKELEFIKKFYSNFLLATAPLFKLNLTT